MRRPRGSLAPLTCVKSGAVSLPPLRSPRVLLVEDNPGDRLLIREAFRELGLELSLHALNNGEQALKYLADTTGAASAPSPDLILLDLNLPGRSGFEVLREIKRNPSLRVIPIIVLSSSDNPADVWNAYRCHANSYVVKPVEIEHLFIAVQTLCDYWLDTALLPGSEPVY